MELMKEFLKILRKTWLTILFLAFVMAIFLAFALKTAPRTLGPIIKEFKEAAK